MSTRSSERVGNSGALISSAAVGSELLEHVSPSAISNTQQCARKLFWAQVARIEAIAFSEPKQLGRLLHFMWEVYFSTGEKQKAIHALERELLEMAEHPDIQSFDIEFIDAAAKAMFNGYVKTFEAFIEQHKLELYDSEIAVETHFSNILPYKLREVYSLEHYPRVKLVMDRLLIQPKSGAVWVLENKTGQPRSKAELENLQMNLQLQVYAMTTRYLIVPTTFPDKKAPGIMFHHIRTPSIRRKVKSGETVDQYLKRLTDDYKDPKRADFYFTSVPVRFSERFLQSAAKDVIAWVSFMQELVQANKTRYWLYPKNNFNCFARGTCEFLPLCRYGMTRETCNMYQPRKEWT